MENLVILKEMKSLLFNDQYIMNFSNRFFHKINNIEIESYDFLYSEGIHDIKIGSVSDVSSRFSGLESLSLSDVVALNINNSEICNFKNLDINSSRIKKVQNNQLQGITSLRKLRLYWNNLNFL